MVVGTELIVAIFPGNSTVAACEDMSRLLQLRSFAFGRHSVVVDGVPDLPVESHALGDAFLECQAALIVLPVQAPSHAFEPHFTFTMRLTSEPTRILSDLVACLLLTIAQCTHLPACAVADAAVWFMMSRILVGSQATPPLFRLL